MNVTTVIWIIIIYYCTTLWKSWQFIAVYYYYISSGGKTREILDDIIGILIIIIITAASFQRADSPILSTEPRNRVRLFEENEKEKITQTETDKFAFGNRYRRKSEQNPRSCFRFSGRVKSFTRVRPRRNHVHRQRLFTHNAVLS